MKKVRRRAGLLFLTAFMALFTCGVAATHPAAAAEPFVDEIRLFAVEDEVYPPNGCEVLFVGSSSFRFWFGMQRDFANRKILKRGFGGATIADINHTFDRIVGRHKPQQIVFDTVHLNGAKSCFTLLCMARCDISISFVEGSLCRNGSQAEVTCENSRQANVRFVGHSG